MTHEDFKNIVSNCETYARNMKFVDEFLDGKHNEPRLLKWFNWWKAGNNAAIFQEIDIVNIQFYQGQENMRGKPSNTRPKDFDKPRESKNQNMRIKNENS